MSALAEALSDPPHRASLKECYEHTDLAWRLAQIPDAAACRGVYFNMIDERAGNLGPATQLEYRRFFQLHRFSPFQFYPVKDYLTRIATVAQIHFGGPGIYDGLFEIQKSAFGAWRRTLMGRAAFAIFGKDFAGLLNALERAYATRMATNYTDLRVTREGPDRFRVTFVNEYVYIEHSMTGALTGVAELCDVRVKTETYLTDPFNGEVVITVLG
jgi:uncharacterized protein (TIGR02265 family)